MIDYPNPFGEEHLQCANNVCVRNAMALKLAKDCQDCGFDTSLQQDMLKQQLDMAQKFKAKFFPHES